MWKAVYVIVGKENKTTKLFFLFPWYVQESQDFLSYVRAAKAYRFIKAWKMKDFIWVLFLFLIRKTKANPKAMLTQVFNVFGDL